MHDARTFPISLTTLPVDSFNPTIYQKNEPLCSIPNEMLLSILMFTPVKGLTFLEMTSKKFTLLIDNIKIWDKLLLKDFPDLFHESQLGYRSTYIKQYLIEENWSKGKFTYTELKTGNFDWSDVIANSECIVSEGANSTLQIWDRKNNTCEEFYSNRGHDGFDKLHLTKNKIAFYVTFGLGGEVRFFDNINKKLISKIECGGQHILHENLFIYKKHPKWNAIQNCFIKDDCIEVIDVDSQKVLLKLESSIDISSGIYIDESQVIAGDNNGAIKFWNLQNGSLLSILKDENQISSISSICFDHECIAAIYADKTINVWNKHTKNFLWSMNNISRFIFDSNYIIVTSQEDNISLMDKFTGNPIFLFPDIVKQGVKKISEIHSRRNQIFTRSSINEIKIWDKSTGLLLQSLQGKLILLSEESLITKLDDKILILNFT